MTAFGKISNVLSLTPKQHHIGCCFENDWGSKGRKEETWKKVLAKILTTTNDCGSMQRVVIQFVGSDHSLGMLMTVKQ